MKFQRVHSIQLMIGIGLALTILCRSASHALADRPGYRLPWLYDTSWRITQGPGGSTSHNAQPLLYAWDFGLNNGTEVRASRAGTVQFVRGDVTQCYYQRNMPVNYVTIYHDDGTATIYYHLSSVVVSVGNRVYQGALVGYSGNTGYTNCEYHLHFQRQQQGGPGITNSIAVTFDESLPPFSQAFNENNLVTSRNYDRAVLYEHINYGGWYLIFPWVDRDLRNDRNDFLSYGEWNDDASSIYVPEGLRVTLYSDIDYTGRAESFSERDPWLGDNYIGNDSVSSLSYEGIFLYQHVSYQGKSEFFTGNDPNFLDNYIGNDQASSICVSPYWAAQLFEHIDYGGDRILAAGCDADLRDNPLNDPNLPPELRNWNDQASSIAVYPPGPLTSQLLESLKRNGLSR